MSITKERTSIRLHDPATVANLSDKLPAYKCILLGNAEAGKTAFFSRFQTGQFRRRSQYQTEANTIHYEDVGIDKCDKIITYEDFEGKIVLWDTAGLERTNSLGKAYFYEARAVLLVYSLIDDATAVDLRHWAEEAQEKVNRQPLYFVIGTHSDKVDPAEKSTIKQRLSRRLVDFEIENHFEVSNLNGKGFDECLKTIAQKILTKQEGVIPKPPNPIIEKKRWWKCW